MRPVIFGRLTDETLPCIREGVLPGGDHNRVRPTLQCFHCVLELTIAMATVADEERHLV